MTLAILFFHKRSSLPRAYMAFLWASVVFGVIDPIASQAVLAKNPANDSEWAKVGGSLVSALIWSSYLHVSRRVAATFVRRLRRPPAVVVEPADVVVAPGA